MKGEIVHLGPDEDHISADFRVELVTRAPPRPCDTDAEIYRVQVHDVAAIRATETDEPASPPWKRGARILRDEE